MRSLVFITSLWDLSYSGVTINIQSLQDCPVRDNILVESKLHIWKKSHRDEIEFYPDTINYKYKRFLMNVSKIPFYLKLQYMSDIQYHIYRTLNIITFSYLNKL